MEERLQKLLSQWGIASRRQAEALIQAKRVKVNGDWAQLGQKVDPSRDVVQLDGRPIGVEPAPQRHYLILNKPLGVVSTCSDPQGRPTVLDLLPKSLSVGQGIHPVGRLDVNSTGALLLTNDGDFTYQLTHPKHQVAKTYYVVVKGWLSPSSLERWRRGIVLADRKTLPAQVECLKRRPGQMALEVVLKEGRNRQIRRVAARLGHPVITLHRVTIGTLSVDSLKLGQHRLLTASEIAELTQAAQSPNLSLGGS